MIYGVNKENRDIMGNVAGTYFVPEVEIIDRETGEGFYLNSNGDIIEHHCFGENWRDEISPLTREA